MMPVAPRCVGEALHQEIERAGDEDDVVALGRGSAERGRARPGRAARFMTAVERLVREEEEAVSRDALVEREEQLVEEPAVDASRPAPSAAPPTTARASGAKAAQRRRLVQQIEEGRVQEVRRTSVPSTSK